jgi:hypothetical protein
MLIAAGRPRRVLILAAPLPVLAVLGLFYAIPRYGIPGAAAVTLAVSCLCAIATVATTSHVWNARPALLSLVRSGITGLIVSVIASLWPATGYLVVLKLGILGPAAVALMVALGEISRNEIRDALALLGEKRVPMPDQNRS